MVRSDILNSKNIVGRQEMPDTGYIICATTANGDNGGTEWSFISDATLDNDEEASVFLKADSLSDYLIATNFDFSSIPQNAKIDGVQALVRKYSTSGNDIEDEYVYLVKNGSIISDCENKSVHDPDWNDGTPDNHIYGGAADTWGCSLTAADVKDSSFGLQIMAHNVNQGDQQYAKICFIKLRVYWSYTGIEAGDSAGGSESVEIEIRMRVEEHQGGAENDSKVLEIYKCLDTASTAEIPLEVIITAPVMDAVTGDDGSVVTPEDEGDGSGLLLAVASSTEYRMFSITDQALSYQWHGVISDVDPVKLTLATRHGGFLRVSAGQVRFVASAFGGVELWSISEWPPPKELTAIFRCKSPGQRYSTKLFEGKLYRASLSEREVEYDAYISSYTETIPAGTHLADWVSTNNLTGFFQKVCTVLGLSLDSSKATADPPALSHTLSTERLVIDVASEVAAFCCHVFWIEDGTLYLQGMSAANGSLNLDNPNDYLRSPNYTDEIPVNRVVAEDHEYVGSDAPYGTDYELSVNYTGDDTQLQTIYQLLNSQWAEIPMPAAIGCGEFVPGKKVTLLDGRLVVESESTVTMRSVSYDFMSQKVIIGGHCSMSSA